MAKVLYIDERPVERNEMLARLLAFGYEALAAEDGQSGLAAAMRNKPDLVLCQSDMTGMSGLDVVRRLREASEECEATLFVMLSEEQDQNIRQQHIDKGADDSLPNSMDFDLLNKELASRLRIVDRQTQRRERELITLYNALSKQKAAVTSSPAENSAAPKMEKKTALPDRDAFTKLASERLKAVQQDGSEAHLTLIEVPGLDALANSGGDAAAGKLLSDIGDFLSSQASDGAGQLDKDRYGLVHGDDVDSKRLQQSIDRLISDSGLDAKGIVSAMAPVALSADGLSPEETARALLYAVNRFAEQGSANFTITNLKEGIAACVEDTVSRISNLRGVINGKRIELYFQPIVDLTDRKPHHYEALARFPGGASPYDTIVFAEQVGMVHELDLAICRKVIEFVEENSHDINPVQVALNLSAQSIESSVFITVMRKMLSKLGKNRKQILLEITESVQIKDYKAVSKIVQELRQDGLRICLDDFGAGDSNFNYLRMFDVDFVKIDGIYVRDVMRSKRDQAFIRAIARLCMEINVSTVAEFVEDEKQAGSLKNLGVNFGQGYLFGKPSPKLLS